MVIKRGEIWWAELPDPIGSEPRYRRPLVIIQSNEFNDSNIGTVIAAVITSNIYLASAPGNILLSKKKNIAYSFVKGLTLLPIFLLKYLDKYWYPYEKAKRLAAILCVVAKK